MARIEKRARELADEPDMREAIEVVLDRSEDGEIRWVDVRDDLSSGQWGRLIERGVLEDGEAGFALADREEIEAGLESPDDDLTSGSDVEVPDSDEVSWSIYDKAAGVVTLLFFVGYSYGPVRSVVGNSIDVVFGPLQDMLPLYAVIMIIATLTGLYSTLLRANLMDMDRMSAYQERMQDIQERRKAAKERGDDEAMDRIQEEQMEAMGDQLGMFKEQFRPMVWIMVLTIPAFLWMYWGIGFRGAEGVWTNLQPIVLPLAGEVGWTDSLLVMPTWIIWYFLCSMAFTQIIQKGLNISMSPST
ncbi:HTR-like protein [Halobacteriales archaeon QS_6_71_20]|nr:MAG: HTR-like protein [Halobacteriales archaeon QS_6_71_20]